MSASFLLRQQVHGLEVKLSRLEPPFLRGLSSDQPQALSVLQSALCGPTLIASSVKLAKGNNIAKYCVVKCNYVLISWKCLSIIFINVLNYCFVKCNFAFSGF
uniref:Ti plasmid pTi15955 T-DNA region n=1 Tax=Agrobacterium tumefaciens TaxID=358 RepID=Q44401_AGRTU|nr:unnamed protein product [Agrobacterium tumefaciens]